jgi:hypothetical protein
MDGPKLFRPMAQNNQCRVVIDFHTDLACDHQVGIHLPVRIQQMSKKFGILRLGMPHFSINYLKSPIFLHKGKKGEWSILQGFQ